MNLLTRVGLREASAFQGYCANHDRDLFAPIERKPLIPNDPEQASLFFLRSISSEYAAKRKAVIHLDMFANTVGSDADPHWHEFYTVFTQGMKLFLLREGPFYLAQIFDIISMKDYGRLHTSWFRVAGTLPLSVTTSVCPWLNDYHEKWSPTKPQPMASFSIIPAKDYTDVVSSWPDYCHTDSKWIQKEMETIEGVERLVNLLGVAESEDFCLNIDFWESLSNSAQELVLSNLHHDLFRGPLNKVPLVIKLKETKPVVQSDRQ